MSLAIHHRLRSSSRLPVLTRSEQASPAEWSVWLLMGLAAACASALPDWNLRIPGHAIVRSVFPMALGFALAPRKWAGAVMGGVGLSAALALRSSGLAEVGMGALTSLALTGPLLDVSVRRARGGWRLYVAIMSAGLLSNLAAFGVKAGEKLMFGSGRSFGSWLAQASWTYPLCGAIAGLISSAVWFHWREKRES